MVTNGTKLNEGHSFCHTDKDILKITGSTPHYVHTYKTSNVNGMRTAFVPTTGNSSKRCSMKMKRDKLGLVHGIC